MGLRHVKDGVRFSPCTPELIDGIIITTKVLLKYMSNLVITSGSDGIHPAGGEHDPHYLGYAFDIRTSELDYHVIPTVVRDLRLELGNQWVVVQESDHLHLQNEKFKDVALITPPKPTMTIS